MITLLRHSLSLAAPWVVLLTVTAVAEACPSCKAALASSDGQEGDWVSGFFWSILFMLSMPFAIVTAFGISIYRATRRRDANAAVPDALARPVEESPPREFVGSS